MKDFGPTFDIYPKGKKQIWEVKPAGGFYFP